MRALAVALAAIASLAGRPQPAGDLAAYGRLVAEYRMGPAASGSNVDREVPDPSSALRAIDSTDRWPVPDLAAAAMLHTDVSLRLIRTGRQSDAAAHVKAATTLLGAAVDRDAEQAEFAARWRDTAAGLFSAYGATEIALGLTLEKLKWLSPSVERTRARKAFEQGLATEIQAAVAGPLSGPQPRRTQVVPPAARGELRAAARHFGAALAADPSFAEAALHLGRVTLLDGRDVEAERWLRAASVARSRPIRYLASMFLGAIAERQARYDDAIRSYQTAQAAFRWGQSAPLALSHVLMRTGREREARTALQSLFADSGARLVEPLWTYLANPATDLGPTLNLLRAEVWR